MNENNVVVKTKNSKGIVGLVIVLIIMVLFLTSYIVYDKVTLDNKNDNKKEVEKTDKVKDITDTELAKKLHDTLITDDKFQGLYFDKKVSISDTTDIDLIKFNLKKYKEDNKLALSEPNYNQNATSATVLTVKKTDFNKYMQDKYNVNYEYNLNNMSIEDKTTTSDLESCVTLIVDNESYKYEYVNASCSSNYFKNKLIKAEEKDNYIYLYDKTVSCGAEGNYVACSSISNSDTYKDTIVECGLDASGNPKECPVERTENYDEKFVEKVADYTITNKFDKLPTHKHTFKKAEDDNYYWVSSEILN